MPHTWSAPHHAVSVAQVTSANVVSASFYDNEIVSKLNTEINAGLVDGEPKSRFADLAATAFGDSPANFGKFIADETDKCKWSKLIRAANIVSD
jgi:hypothetical protein